MWGCRLHPSELLTTTTALESCRSRSSNTSAEAKRPHSILHSNVHIIVWQVCHRSCPEQLGMGQRKETARVRCLRKHVQTSLCCPFWGAFCCSWEQQTCPLISWGPQSSFWWEAGKKKPVLWLVVSWVCPGISICLCRTYRHACTHVLTTTLTLSCLRHIHIPGSQPTHPTHQLVCCDTHWPPWLTHAARLSRHRGHVILWCAAWPQLLHADPPPTHTQRTERPLLRKRVGNGVSWEDRQTFLCNLI